MSIKNNTASLQSILDAVNALPEAGGVVELPELTNEGTAADLSAGKQLIDGEGNIVVGTAKELPSAEEAAFGVESGNIEYGITAATAYNSTMAGYTIGWQFKATQDISIVGLRYYENFNVNYPRILKLWNSSGECTAEVECPAQTVGAWTEIVYFDTPVNIGFDEIYTVSTRLKDLTNATIGNYYAKKSTATFNPKISFIQPVYYALQQRDGFPETYLNLSGGTPVPLVDIIIAPIQAELPDDYQIQRTTMDNIAEEVQRITGIETKLSTAQIISNLSKLEIENLEDYEGVTF